MKVEEIYVDPSVITRLYVHQEHSREVAAWRRKIGGTLQVTHHAKVETINGICRAAFLGFLDENALGEALAEYFEDWDNGRFEQADLLWRSALNRAAALSQEYTPLSGVRSLDILHLACALELKMRYFFTLDKRQGELASNLGFRLVRFRTENK